MTRALERLGAFQPRQLQTMRGRTQALHPGTATVPAPIASDDSRRIRELIEARRDNPDELQRLGRSLSPREMSACVVGLETWELLRPVVAIVIRAKPMGTLVPALWRAWQRCPDVSELAELLREFAGRYGWARAVGERYADVAPGWPEDRPGIAIVRWLASSGWSYSDIARLPASPFTTDTPLLRRVRDALMTDGSTEQLRAEGDSRLLGWATELNPTDRLTFERNYLGKLHSREWGDDVLESILERHGLPRRPLRPAFWDPVAQTIKDEFQRIIIERILSEAFGEDSDRHRYWKRRIELDTPRNLTKARAGTTDYVVIDFGAFVVVEFFEVGHAAYFYSQGQFESIRRESVRHPSALKSILGPPDRRYRDNRLIHSGDWQPKADLMLRDWARSYR